MRFFRCLLIMSALSVTPAFSQSVGLQLVDTTFKDQQDSTFGTFGVAIGDDISFAGVRAAYALIDDLKVFADIGLTHAELLEEEDAGMGIVDLRNRRHDDPGAGAKNGRWPNLYYRGLVAATRPGRRAAVLDGHGAGGDVGADRAARWRYRLRLWGVGLSWSTL